MTDLERIELACRRIADRERAKHGPFGVATGADREPINLTLIQIFEALAQELATPERTITWEMNDKPGSRRRVVSDTSATAAFCIHGKPLVQFCHVCDGLIV